MSAGNGGDGRHIDERIAGLTGEGAQQVVADAGSDAHASVWRQTPVDASREDPTYYDRPVLKEPVWIWAVPAYFYAGGAAGGAAVLGLAAERLGGREVDGLVARARWVAAGGAAIGSALLVYDLGRPERFLNMLRVFRPTSAMSVGSWVLALATPLLGASALLSRVRPGRSMLGDILGTAAGVLALPLSGYTAVLLSSTAVPVWQETASSLPFLFVSSGAASAAALLELAELNDKEQTIVTRFGSAARIAELIAAEVVTRDASRVERVGRPYEEGISGALWRTAKALTTVSLALSIVPGRARGKRVLSGLMGTAGALSIRFAVFHAGKASARDPRATFHSQRDGE